MARRSSCPGARMCVCPTYSSKLRGRIRAASGSWRGRSTTGSCVSATGFAAALNRSSLGTARNYQSVSQLTTIYGFCEKRRMARSAEPITILLTCTSGPDTGKRVAVSERIATIGRAIACEVASDDPDVAQQHLSLQLEAGKLTFTACADCVAF